MKARDTGQAILSELAEAEFTRAVNNDLARYQATGDARFVWKAIGRYAQADKPLPMDYLRKLAEWGGKIQQLARPAEITAALELSGDEKNKVGPAHSAAYTKRWRLASEVQRVHLMRPGPLIAAIRIVAQNSGESVSVVKRSYHAVFTAPVKQPRRPAPTDLTSIISGWR